MYPFWKRTRRDSEERMRGNTVCDGEDKYLIACAAPILSEGDVLGCVLFVGTQDALTSSETDYKLAQTIAGFLGRHMEA